ncbi:DUF1684 domain-containing protein [Microbacterium sp. B2969]|uniref:DUF1684 domain-containing protein n=1 Tax=Microbacterium alkaliflavum TaxID=3248839 RepID=A0ABW7Q4P7_9MICO
MTLIDPLSSTIDRDEFTTAWSEWRDANEARRRDPYGYLSYSAVYRLDSTPQRVVGIPGSWSIDADGPVVELGEGEHLVIDDRQTSGTVRFGAVAEREFRRAARFGDIVVELSQRGGVQLLRPIDPQYGLRDDYVETPAYAPDPTWLVRGEFVPFDRPRDTEIDAALSGITHHHDAVGEVVFELGGLEHRLLILEGVGGATFAPFRDATSGVTTYGASRTLAVTLPATAGPAVLDFNRAANLQCAYTDFAPCPLAPAQNRLPVAIEAGEQTPVFREAR